MIDRVFAAKISDNLPNCVHVDASSVGSYFWESSQNAFGSDDYINCAPPWETFALHFSHPSRVVSNNNNDSEDTCMWHQILTGLGSKKNYAFVFIEKGCPDDGWGLLYFLFTDNIPSPGSSTMMPVAGGEIALEKDGSISKGRINPEEMALLALFKSTGQHVVVDESELESEDKIARTFILSHPVVRQRIGYLQTGNPLINITSLFSHSLNVLSDLACLAITFLHCKNIGLTDINCPPAAVKKGKKYRNRQDEKKVDTYKVLEISPFRSNVKAANGGEDPGLKKALHICRGHFKTYTPEKPLLGKHTGTYWFPQHLKGNPEHGKITKEYRVGPLS